jgi:hypothetical protein
MGSQKQWSGQIRAVFDRLPDWLTPGAKTALMAVPVLMASNTGFFPAVLVVVVAGLVGALARSVSLSVLSLGISIAAHIAVVTALSTVWADYSIDGGVVLSSTVAGGALIGLWMGRRWNSEDVDLGPIAVVVAVLTLLVWPLRRMGSVESLSFIGGVDQFAEDNGAWLVGISAMADGTDTLINPGGGFAGGNSTAVTLGITRAWAGWFAPWFTGSNADGARILVLGYVLGILAVSVCSVIIATRVAAGRSRAVQWGTAALVPSFFAFAAGLGAIGHYSALVATGFIVLALAISVLSGGQKPLVTWASVVAIGLALLAGGLAWSSLMPLFGFFVVWTSISWVTQGGVLSGRLRALRVGVVGAVGMAALTWLLPNYVAVYRDFDQILYNLTLVGGIPVVRVEVMAVIALLAGMAAMILSTVSRLATRVLGVVGLMWGALVVMSFAFEPFEMRYGALKYSYMAVTAVLPVAMGGCIGWASAKTRYRHAVPFALLIVVVLTVLTPPGARWNWLYQTDETRSPWAAAVVEAASKDGGGAVGCVTVDNEGRFQENYETYLCSRVALALTGKNKASHYLWMSANVCEVNPSQSAQEWTDEFLQELTVVVLVADVGKPCGVGDSSPFDAFGALDWSTISLIGVDSDPLPIGN